MTKGEGVEGQVERVHQRMDSDRDFLEFAKRIKHKTGLDLLAYKQDQVRRRLTSLRDRRGFATFASFYHELDRHPDVFETFMDQLTINVTEFYRNPERWKVLGEQVVPDILKGTNRLKCWSAACSTGEEPYSLVLLLSEFIGLQNIEVHATDIDKTVMNKAKEGRYSPMAVKDVPVNLLRKFFRLEQGKYVLADEVKKPVRFREHNLLSHPFDKGYHLIVCRNVMIYFTEEAKYQLYRRFAESLKPGGYLFVGGTEQILGSEQYGLVPMATFFYRKI